SEQAELTSVLALALIVMVPDVIGTWFRSQLRFKLVVIASVAANLIGGAVKILFVVHYQSVLPLGYATLAQNMVIGGLLFYYGWRDGLRLSFADFSKADALEFVRAGFPLMLSSVAVFAYTRANVFFLDSFRTKAELGLYTAATRITEVA